MKIAINREGKINLLKVINQGFFEVEDIKALREMVGKEGIPMDFSKLNNEELKTLNEILVKLNQI